MPDAVSLADGVGLDFLLPHQADSLISVSQKNETQRGRRTCPVTQAGSRRVGVWTSARPTPGSLLSL